MRRFNRESRKHNHRSKNSKHTIQIKQERNGEKNVFNPKINWEITYKFSTIEAQII